MPTPHDLFAQAQRLHRAGQPAAAIPLYRELLRLAPGEAEIPHQLGNALKSLGRFSEALGPLADAARLAPTNAAIRLNHGVALLELTRFAEAEAEFRAALAGEPQRPEAHNILGHALLSQGKLTEAEASFRAALQLRPDYAPAHDNLGRLFRAQGRMAEAVASYRAALVHQPRATTHSNLLLALNYLPEMTPAEVFAEHHRWAALYAEPLTAAIQRPPPAPRGGRRLRVGYVSPDFCHHAVAYFFEPVLAAHDRARVEVFCYSNTPLADAVTARLRATAEHWRDIAPLADEATAALIRGDGIDVLVDLAGHTARHRLLVFARRSASAQITWLGYPNTTGLSAMDARLTDAICDPVGATDSFHTEKLLRMPGPFSVYQPPADAPAPVITDGPPARPTITFGCFNNFAKVTPAVIAIWARLLATMPTARLFLKSRGLSDPATAARIRADFAHHGIAPDRITLDGRELSVAAHLALYHRVDVALDTFPYNGATTTCEALWMGVPVVTLAGRTHVARVGASLLTHLGEPGWIAHDSHAYLAIARALATDGARLSELRATLREKMRASPLCDAPRFTRALETALEKFAEPNGE
jgi:predicted O-linked N-acetylglucosamine transferase (SPINDLY family)